MDKSAQNAFQSRPPSTEFEPSGKENCTWSIRWSLQAASASYCHLQQSIFQALDEEELCRFCDAASILSNSIHSMSGHSFQINPPFLTCLVLISSHFILFEIIHSRVAINVTWLKFSGGTIGFRSPIYAHHRPVPYSLSPARTWNVSLIERGSEMSCSIYCPWRREMVLYFIVSVRTDSHFPIRNCLLIQSDLMAFLIDDQSISWHGRKTSHLLYASKQFKRSTCVTCSLDVIWCSFRYLGIESYTIGLLDGVGNSVNNRISSNMNFSHRELA